MAATQNICYSRQYNPNTNSFITSFEKALQVGQRRKKSIIPICLDQSTKTRPFEGNRVAKATTRTAPKASRA